MIGNKSPQMLIFLSKACCITLPFLFSAFYDRVLTAEGHGFSGFRAETHVLAPHTGSGGQSHHGVGFSGGLTTGPVISQMFLCVEPLALSVYLYSSKD